MLLQKYFDLIVPHGYAYNGTMYEKNRRFSPSGWTFMSLPFIEGCCKGPILRRYRLWQYGQWSFQTGGTKLERFLPKNQHTQRKLLNFENWVSGEVSKIGHHFRVIEKLMLSKNVNNKKCAPKLIFINEYVYSQAKIFLILYPLLEKSTTRIATTVTQALLNSSQQMGR